MVWKMQKKYKVLAILGKAGSGKNYLLKHIKQNISSDLINIVVADTTRPPRENEKDGEDYNFLPSNISPLYLITQKNYIEIAFFKEWFYGTPLEALDENKLNILITNPKGLEQLENNELLKTIPVYLERDPKKRLISQLDREEFPDYIEICRRFLADEKDFNVSYENLTKEFVVVGQVNGWLSLIYDTDESDILDIVKNLQGRIYFWLK